MAAVILRLLLGAAFLLVFLSAAAAQMFGLERLRIAAFVAIILALCAAALLAGSRLAVRGRALPLACMALLLVLLPMQAGRPFDPLDYKIVVVLAALFCAPDIGRAVGERGLVDLVMTLLGLYVAASAAQLVVGGGPFALRGHDGILRLDVSGSLVTHSSLCLLYLLLALQRLTEPAPLRVRLWFAATAAAAVLMLAAAATRTTLATLLLAALFDAISAPRPGRVRRFARIVTAGLVVFVLISLFVSDAMFMRLAARDGDFSSGRAHSLAWWFSLGLDHPLGIGIGGVRQMLADGRPAIAGGRLLEWPHNEFVRFWVEGGWPGLALVGLLVGGLSWRALRFARLAADPRVRALVLALAADLIAQSLLQNYFNGVYHATVMVTLLGALSANGRLVAARARARSWPEEALPCRTGAGVAARRPGPWPVNPTSSSATLTGARPTTGRFRPSTS